MAKENEITVKRCKDYLSQWMDFTAIKREKDTSEDFIHFSAKNRMLEKMQVIVTRESTSEYHDVYERPFGSDEKFEMTDCMTKKD
jgi:hypothetical protein